MRQIRLTTTGRKTGQGHEVIVNAFPDGDDLVVVGSYAGSPKDPDWAANLKVDPDATVRHGKDSVRYRARIAEGSERERLWSLVVEGYPTYETYQRRTDRLIPLFVLEPAT